MPTYTETVTTRQSPLLEGLNYAVFLFVLLVIFSFGNSSIKLYSGDLSIAAACAAIVSCMPTSVSYPSGEPALTQASWSGYAISGREGQGDVDLRAEVHLQLRIIRWE